ncbi:MPPV-243 ankyrin repeat protein [Magpiepox virus 2]|nr:MPPV-243 ankyrin repeat protein [Magpiepox virus 2]
MQYGRTFNKKVMTLIYLVNTVSIRCIWPYLLGTVYAVKNFT